MPSIRFLFSAILTLLGLIVQIGAQAQDRSETESAAKTRVVEKKPIKLPGLVVDFKNRCVDLEAKVCLEKGLLELVACTPGSKEHESMVAVTARPIHIHTALLLLGLKNGNPAISKKIGTENSRWVDLPPRGDPLNLFFVFKDANNQLVERPVQSFVAFSGESNKKTHEKAEGQFDNRESGDSGKFPEAFLFAGSQLLDQGKGPRIYLAEKSGNVISISTFGDELLCLPEVRSHQNNSLMWRIKPNQLPKVGTRILLRLRPAKNAPGRGLSNQKDSPKRGLNNDQRIKTKRSFSRTPASRKRKS